jgi:carbamoyl-phosphate synthase large subunit
MVTGVGAIMGYGLLRSLKRALPDIHLIGTDIYTDAVGRAWCERFEQAPLTASEQYLEWLQEVTMRHEVDLVIPGIEQDVQRLSDCREQIAGLRCRFALNNPLLIALSRDKWLMHQALLDLGDEARIPSYLSGDFSTLSTLLGLPFILKPRRSYASKGLVRVHDESTFALHAHLLGEHLLAQPIVGSDDEEYTVGVFGDGHGGVPASITLQRRLAQDGSTAKARVRKDAGLDEVVGRLCKHFRPLGPTNLQFRRDGQQWKLLEINPRVSSTSSMRTAFGFNEAAMCVDYYLHGKLPVQPNIRDGFAVRYIEDYVLHDRAHF